MSKKILIVDDDRFIRDVAQVSLRKVAGWSAIVAASGLEGLEQARQEKPDAILLDISMPGVDGFAVLQHLQNDPVTRSIPVILLTAKSTSQDFTSMTGTNLAGVIIKPFDPLEIGNQITNLLGWQP